MIFRAARLLLLIATVAVACFSEQQQTKEDPQQKEDPPRLLCESGDPQPPNRVNTTVHVAQLRNLMAAVNVSAYIVLTNDDHQSEYTSVADERRRFISGFSGSAGWAVITATRQALWTDSRYYLQADEQLDCNWELKRDGLPGVERMEAWIAEQLEPGQLVSADARTVPQSQWLGWIDYFNSTGELVQETEGNLVDVVWGAERPPYSVTPVTVLNEVLYAGLTWQQKAEAAAARVREAGAEGMVVNALDEVAWLLNMRADDVPFLPVVRAYMTLELRNNGTNSPLLSLYMDMTKVTPELEQHLAVGTPDGVKIFEYENFWTDLESMSTRLSSILLAKGFSYNLGASHAIHSRVAAEKVKSAAPPVAQLKEQKNPTESQGLRNAHVRDAAALITFLAKLEAEVQASVPWDELKASEEVARLRSLQALSRGPSFVSISAAGSHAAMPHYEPVPETNASINTSSIYKLDSGGQYLDGTTDVTRTMHFGTPSAEQVEMYTRVLAGCADMATVVFPHGTTLSQLEILARQALYAEGRDYGHGTTHGIGMFLGVHEAFNTTLNENFFGSQEPGYYVDGEYGIRLENIVTVVKADFNETTAGKTFLKFDSVTLVPYEPNLIDVTLLSPRQVAWVNSYHERVRALVRPLLVQQGAQQALAWLDLRTQPLQPVCKHHEL